MEQRENRKDEKRGVGGRKKTDCSRPENMAAIMSASRVSVCLKDMEVAKKDGMTMEVDDTPGTNLSETKVDCQGSDVTYDMKAEGPGKSPIKINTCSSISSESEFDRELENITEGICQMGISDTNSRRPVLRSQIKDRSHVSRAYSNNTPSSQIV